MNDQVVNKMMENIFSRIDNISNLMWGRIAQVIDGKVYINHKLITKQGARENANEISKKTFDFSNSIFTSFK